MRVPAFAMQSCGNLFQAHDIDFFAVHAFYHMPRLNSPFSAGEFFHTDMI